MRYTVALHVFWVTLLLWWAVAAMGVISRRGWLERGVMKVMPVEFHSGVSGHAIHAADAGKHRPTDLH